VLRPPRTGASTQRTRICSEGSPSIRRVAEHALSQPTAPSHEPSTRTESLTDVETQVLRLVAMSHSAGEISDQLRLALDTVLAVKAGAISKLGLQSRVHVIVRGGMDGSRRPSDRVRPESEALISGDNETVIGELKGKPGRELQVHSSGALIRWLLEKELVDQINLLTFPVVVGQRNAAVSGNRSKTLRRSGCALRSAGSPKAAGSPG
jgi:DNA-binding CsgD family transcriptional regulator